MDRAIFFEVFDHNGIWYGTATFEAAQCAGLFPNLSYPIYGRASWATNGWAYIAKR